MARKIKKILCPVNLRHAVDAHPGYDEALELAKKNDAEVILTTVAPEIERNLNIYNSEKCWTDQLVQFLKDYPPGEVRTRIVVRKGSEHRQIVKIAKTEEVDLIVIQSANPRVQDYLLGSTASHVVSHAPCSVYVVR